MQNNFDESNFNNIPEVLSKIKIKLNSSPKLFKTLALNDKSKLQLEHFLLSIANYIRLIEQEVLIVQRKSAELQDRNKELQGLYDNYYEKYLNIQKESQIQVNLLNSKNSKLIKQNQYLTFVNKGLKYEMEERKKYLGDYKQNKSKEIKNIMKDVEIQVKNGAEKVCQKITKFIDMWDLNQKSSRSLNSQENDNSVLKMEEFKTIPKAKPNQTNFSLTTKKKSLSANHNSTEVKKKKIQNKLAKIVLEQAKLGQKNQRYLEMYLS